MKRILLLAVSLFASISTLIAQSTESPKVTYSSTSQVTIDRVNCNDERTVIILNAANLYRSGGLDVWTSISSKTALSYTDPQTGRRVTLYPRALHGGEEFISMRLNTMYRLYDFGKVPVWPVYFVDYAPLPYGVTVIDIEEEEGRRPWSWKGVQIKPRIKYESPVVARSIDEIYTLINETNNEYKGIYEELDASDSNYQLAFLQKDEKYYLVFAGGASELKEWSIGDAKAELRQTAVASVFKATWYMKSKYKETNCLISFEPGLMRVKIGDSEATYIRMSITGTDLISSPNGAAEKWSGTGFALKNGYIVTNSHVAENAKTIEVFGVNGNFSAPYKADIVGLDKVNDLALLKITDGSFTGFGSIPYGVKSSMAEVGENVFVLGYPLTTTMGEEIKLTNGIISSRTGFEGDVALYQISVPIQPGNSGGPLIDERGNLIGVVCAKHAGAENVSYAIKMGYLRNLVESVADLSILPSSSSTSGMALKDQVKRISPFVFLIKCSK